MGFETDRFVDDCQQAVAQDDTPRGVLDLVARAVADPGAVLASLGEPSRPGIERLYVGPELTVLNVLWGPGMTIGPHDHRMWAVIGIYTGREDNIFWRRLPDHPEGKIEAAGARALSTGDAVPLGRDLVHSVTNPIGRLTGALHVYGGDFFAKPRSQWDPEDLLEAPYDVESTRQLFEAAARRMDAG